MSKSVHISIDDVTFALQRLSINNYASIYEDRLFGFLHRLHKVFGLRVTLYLYAQDDEWSIADVPDKYKNEFETASEWLKFGFHAVSDVQKQDNVLPDFEEKFQYVIQHIKRFAGDASIAHILRLHYWFYPIEYITVLKKNGIKEILCKPDCETSEIDGIPVWSTDIRIEQDKRIARRIWRNKGGDQPMVVFTHEWALNKKRMMKLAIAALVIRLCGYNYICE